MVSCAVKRRGAGSTWGTHQCAKVIPDLGDVWIESYGAGVRVERIAILIDLIIEYSDGAPEGRVPAITVHCLLVGFVGFRVFLL